MVRKFIQVERESYFLCLFPFRTHMNTHSAYLSMDGGLGIIPSFVLKLKLFTFVWNDLISAASIKRKNTTT